MINTQQKADLLFLLFSIAMGTAITATLGGFGGGILALIAMLQADLALAHAALTMMIYLFLIGFLFYALTHPLRRYTKQARLALKAEEQAHQAWIQKQLQDLHTPTADTPPTPPTPQNPAPTQYGDSHNEKYRQATHHTAAQRSPHPTGEQELAQTEEAPKVFRIISAATTPAPQQEQEQQEPQEQAPPTTPAPQKPAPTLESCSYAAPPKPIQHTNATPPKKPRRRKKK